MRRILLIATTSIMVKKMIVTITIIKEAVDGAKDMVVGDIIMVEDVGDIIMVGIILMTGRVKMVGIGKIMVQGIKVAIQAPSLMIACKNLNLLITQI